MIVDDLMGLGPNYAIFIALGFAIALPVAALAGRLLPAPRALVFAAAGLVCMLVMLTLMKEVFFGVQIIAGARSLPGFWAQAIAGALAGLAFTVLTPPRAGQNPRKPVNAIKLLGRGLPLRILWIMLRSMASAPA